MAWTLHDPTTLNVPNWKCYHQTTGKSLRRLSIIPEIITKRFTRAPRAKVEEILKALETLGFV